MKKTLESLKVRRLDTIPSMKRRENKENSRDLEGQPLMITITIQEAGIMRGLGTLNLDDMMTILDLQNMTDLIATMSPEVMTTIQGESTMNVLGIMTTGGMMMRLGDQEMKATMADHQDMKGIGDTMTTTPDDTLIIQSTMDHAEEAMSLMITLKT